MKILLEVITPTKALLKEEIDELTISTVNGEISILPNHIDLLTKIVPCEMTIRKNGKTDYFAIAGGFLEISKNKITVLADHAIRAEDIEIEKVKEAQVRAEKAILNSDNEKAYNTFQDEIRRAALQLQIAHKHKSKRPH